jgi:hypothetical protein
VQQILQLFADTPASSSSAYWQPGRYSIHRAVQCAHTLYGKALREWIGPDSMSAILYVTAGPARTHCLIRKVITEQSPQAPLRVVVARDGLFNTTQIRGTAAWQPVLVLAPLLLGLTGLPGPYCAPLRATLKLPHVLGCIAGRPSAAHWLIGCEEQGEHVTLLALDPHVTRAAINGNVTRAQLSTCVATGVTRLKLTELDACLALAFLCPRARDLDELAQSLAQVRCGTTRKSPLTAI